nr:GGDEF domain-containing protein [uncultured Tyzzerella sp.]
MNYKNYYEEVQDHTIIAQRILSISLFLFFILYIPVINIIEYIDNGSYNPTTWICILQCILSLISYLAFKYYFVKNRKYAILAAYLNVTQIIVFLEIQFFLYSYFVSYMMISCVIMATALTVIGVGFGYFSCIFPIFFIDTLIGVIKLKDMSVRDMNLFIMDNVFIVMFAIGIHICFSMLKYKDFKLKHELLYLSENDSLTGLLNRNAAEKFVEKHSKSKELSAMFIIDIDNFKQLNDTLGHMKGDEALIEISNKLKSLFRHNDCISRLGGDEFMIFLPNVLNKECVINKANQVLNIFPLAYEDKGNTVEIGCSIGITFCETNIENEDLYEKLYKEADQAMYEVKKNGKNQVKVYNS